MVVAGSSLLPRLSLVAASRRYSLVVVQGLLTAVASLVVEHRLYARGLTSCGSQALEHWLSNCGTGLVAQQHVGSS